MLRIRNECYIYLGNPEENQVLEELEVEGKVMLKLKSGIRVGCKGIDWIPVAQYRDRWLDFVNTVTFLWIL
jgi:hypothetical protein